MVIGHPLGAVGAAGLFVGDAEVDQGSLWPPPVRCELSERHSHGSPLLVTVKQSDPVANLAMYRLRYVHEVR
jgi:hypothetical protein